MEATGSPSASGTDHLALALKNHALPLSTLPAPPPTWASTTPDSSSRDPPSTLPSSTSRKTNSPSSKSRPASWTTTNSRHTSSASRRTRITRFRTRASAGSSSQSILPRPSLRPRLMSPSLQISRHSAYDHILQLAQARDRAILLDIGCCVRHPHNCMRVPLTSRAVRQRHPQSHRRRVPHGEHSRSRPQARSVKTTRVTSSQSSLPP